MPPRFPQPQIEIVRSFSFKLNVGNYETRDFFCSQKVSCAAENADEVSALVAAWVQQEVQTTVKEYMAARERQKKGER